MGALHQGHLDLGTFRSLHQNEAMDMRAVRELAPWEAQDRNWRRTQREEGRGAGRVFAKGREGAHRD